MPRMRLVSDRLGVSQTHGWNADGPVGACGGGECEYDSGQWVPCELHHRELGQMKPPINRQVLEESQT